jgi:hypothetical protein
LKGAVVADLSQAALITDLARDTVERVAPHELPLFDATSAAYFRDPSRVRGGGQKSDQSLGFGASEGIAFLTPVVLAMTSAVVQYLAAELTDSLKEEASGAVQDLVRTMFRKLRREDGEDPIMPPPLTVEQLARIRRVAHVSALRHDLPADQADRLANAMLADLVAGESLAEPHNH